MKKLLGTLLLITFLSCPFSFYAAGEGGVIPEFFIYTLDNGNATITGYRYEMAWPEEINIPDTLDGHPVVAIGPDAFNGLLFSTSITIPDSVTTIGDSAFSYCCDLKSIIIPNSVISIGKSAFECCSNLEKIEVDQNHPVFSSVKGVLFDKAQKTLHAYPSGRNASSYDIPQGTEQIGESAFYGNDHLKTINVPDSVTNIGKEAFTNCSKLSAINIDLGNPFYTSIEGVLFDKAKNVLYKYPGGKTAKKYQIPEDVVTVGESAFANNERLTSITIPDSVITIDRCAFYGCKKLKSINISDNLTSIGQYAFYMSGLSSLIIPKSVTSIDEKAILSCEALTSIDVAADNPAYSSVDGVLFDKTQTVLYIYPSNKKGASYQIPQGVEKIGYNAFCDSNLKKISFPDSVTDIGDIAFTVCDKLESIIIPDSVTSIGNRAFYYCPSLKSITIPESVTSIGQNAFDYCDRLKILVKKDSYAQQYAIQNNIPYVLQQ